jgi:tetratricopeptide (TPR) repeat protein
MKKILFAVALSLFTANVIAQTPEEKAAEKAAKQALKEATKQANKHLIDGLSYSTQVQTLYQTILLEKQKGDSSNDKLIIENEAKIQEYSVLGIKALNEALATDYIKENKMFEAYRAVDNMASMVLNKELVAASKKEQYSRENLTLAVFALAEACHGELKYGNPKDEVLKVFLQEVRTKFPKTHAYFAYLCQFCIEAKDLPAAEKVLDAYINFPINYPEIAEHELVKNPEYPASQFAFNIFYTAFNEKNVELMDKYYDLALQFDNKDSHNFVLRAKPQMLKEQGKTDEWIAELHKVIAYDPTCEISEIAMQQLMSHYNSLGADAADKFTAELHEKYPNNKIANYCRGFAFYAKNDFENAIKFFEKSVEIDPNYADAIYNCGYCWYQFALNKARAISGKKMKSQAEINAAEAEVKGYFAKAAPYFEKYRDFETNDPSKWANPLKVIYTNTGQKDKAAEMEPYIN